MVFFVGTCIGSFLTMLSYRLFEKDENLFHRSQCPKCKNIIKYRSLIPIFSWLFQGGKCSFCKEKISIRYPLIEFGNGLLFLYIYYLFDYIIAINTIYWLGLANLLYLMLIVDLEKMEIPLELQKVLIYFIAVYIVFSKQTIVSQIISGICYYSIIQVVEYLTTKIKKKDSLGGADLILIGLLGTIMGFKFLLLFFLLCGLIGVIYGLLFMVINKLNRLETINLFPFAPVIIISFALIEIIKLKNYAYFLKYLIF